MVKKILVIILIAVIIFFGANINSWFPAEENPEPTPTPMEEITPTPFPDLPTIDREPTTTEDMDEAKVLLDEANNLVEIATNMIVDLETLGYDSDHPAILMAAREMENTHIIQQFYQNQYDKLYDEYMWEVCSEEWPVATEIWLYMKDLGWSDAVCAGILGNIMTEAGNGFLDINPWALDPTHFYFGICQWNSANYGRIHGKPLSDQLDFLRDTIKEEIDWAGFMYANNFDLDAFLELDNPGDVALAFAVCYERCASYTYDTRINNAWDAYEYYVW